MNAKYIETNYNTQETNEYNIIKIEVKELPSKSSKRTTYIATLEDGREVQTTGRHMEFWNDVEITDERGTFLDYEWLTPDQFIAQQAS